MCFFALIAGEKKGLLKPKLDQIGPKICDFVINHVFKNILKGIQENYEFVSFSEMRPSLVPMQKGQIVSKSVQKCQTTISKWAKLDKVRQSWAQLGKADFFFIFYNQLKT